MKFLFSEFLDFMFNLGICAFAWIVDATTFLAHNIVGFTAMVLLLCLFVCMVCVIGGNADNKW